MRFPQYEEVGRSIELVDTEEAKAVEEELVELMTDQIERDTQQVEIADADGNPNGVPGHKEIGHSIEVVGAIVGELVELVTDQEEKDILETKIKNM